jgi:alpha-mannosidase
MSGRPLTPFQMRLASAPGCRRLAVSPLAEMAFRFGARSSPALRAFWSEAFAPAVFENVAPAGEQWFGDFRFRLVNVWIAQALVGLRLTLDGRPVNPARIDVAADDDRRCAANLGELDFPADQPLTVTVRGARLRDGLHFLGVELRGSRAPWRIPDAPLLMTAGRGALYFGPAAAPAPGDPSSAGPPALVHIAPHLLADVDWFADESTFQALAAGFLRAVFRQLDADPAATFAFAQQPVLEAFAAADPAALPRLQQFVQRGQAEPVMSFYVEPAACLIGGESLVRQIVAWQTVCRDAFGRVCAVGWAPLADGLPATLPQLLRQAGVLAIAFAHGAPDSRPGDFIWQGLDGSRVRAHRLHTPAAWPLPREPRSAREKLNRLARRLAADRPVGPLLCPAGSPFGEPLGAPSATLAPAGGETGRFEFRASLPSRFFADALDEALPVVGGEYVPQETPLAQPSIRRLHRQAEAAVAALERTPLIVGDPADAGRVQMETEVWDLLLRCQTRTALGGAHSAAASARLAARLRRIRDRAELAIQTSLRGFAGRARPLRDAAYVVAIANALGFAREALATADLPAIAGRPPALCDGAVDLPYQIVSAAYGRDGELRSVRAAFVAALPALGSRLYWTLPADGGRPAAPERAKALAADCRLWNGWVTVDFDPANGAIRTIEDHEHGHVHAPGDAGLLICRRDPHDDGDEADSLRGRRHFFIAEGREILEHGPVRASLRFVGRVGPHRARLVYRLSQASKTLEAEVELECLEKCGVAEVRLPLPPGVEPLQFEIPYGSAARNGGIFPLLNFVDVAAADGGLAVLNDGLAGCRVTRRYLHLRLAGSLDRLRLLDAGHGAPLTGVYSFRYGLFPHANSAGEARVYRRGLDFNSPLLLWQGPPAAEQKQRSGPAARSLIALSPDSLEVGALRRDAAGGFELRLVERCGAPAAARLRLRARWRKVEIVDLLGNVLHELKTPRWGKRRGEIELSFRPFEIKTLKFTT